VQINKTLKVLSVAIDPGFAKSGYAVLRGTRSPDGIWKAKLYDYGVILTKASKQKTRGQLRVSSDDQRRLDDLRFGIDGVCDSIKGLQKELKPHCTLTGLEWFTPFRSGGRGWTTALGVATWYHMCKREMNSAHTFIWLPTDIKKETCGQVKASKEDVQDVISEKFGIEYDLPKATYSEQADAIAIAVMNLHEYDRLFLPE